MRLRFIQRFLKANIGGSGLGAATFQIVTTKNTTGKADKCCDDKCYCGKVDSFVERKLKYTIYIAGLRPAENTYNGYIIDATTQSQALDHELQHVKVRKEVAAKLNPYVASKYPTIKTKQYSSENTAKTAAATVGDLSDTEFYTEFATKIGKPPSGFDNMDGIEASDTVGGKWVHPSNPSARASLFNNISNYTPTVNVRDDEGTQDCQ